MACPHVAQACLAKLYTRSLTLEQFHTRGVGMPYPQNLETANRVEAAVRERGAIPATIALMHGKVYIGLDTSQLQQLASQGPKCIKVSRRDILPVLASGQFGATTVAATMLLAHMAGIRVFVTGGIGGVHRGVQDTMDVSADLTELGRTPVAVVCAGVKSVRSPARHYQS
jgi:pseudouridine-5'-phosphate glycosidase